MFAGVVGLAAAVMGAKRVILTDLQSVLSATTRSNVHRNAHIQGIEQQEGEETIKKAEVEVHALDWTQNLSVRVV